ncbi:MAG: hypothetical protein ACYCOU_22180, partial [Sulfobacillus sp.]
MENYSDQQIKEIVHAMAELLDTSGTDSQSFWEQVKNNSPEIIGVLSFISRSLYASLLLGLAIGMGHAEILMESGKQFLQGGQDAVNGFAKSTRQTVAEYRTSAIDWPTFSSRVE